MNTLIMMLLLIAEIHKSLDIIQRNMILFKD